MSENGDRFTTFSKSELTVSWFDGRYLLQFVVRGNS